MCTFAHQISSPMKPYTMNEIDAMLEESERDFEARRCYTTEEVLKMCEIGRKQIENGYYFSTEEVIAACEEEIDNNA